MQTFFQNESQFNRTRVVLSLWYTFILLLILVGFSVALYVTYNNDLSRIVLRQDFGTHVPRTLSRPELRLVVIQVRELRKTTQVDLFIIDLITLIIGGGLSYFLAGKTLQPIQKNMESQKLFIADASHELKNPIATVQSACEVVLRSKNKTKEDYREALEQVLDQSKRLGRLVTDLLSLSVLDAASTKTRTKCSLSDIAEKQLAAMRPLLETTKLTLSQSISPYVFVLGDEDKLQQLVIILLDNAFKYTPLGGTITVTVRKKPQPQLLVQDTGIGIAQEKHEDIFKRFYQADVSHASKGAGLGLAIADSIMKLHRGTIRVESSIGKGSTFICTFPSVK